MVITALCAGGKEDLMGTCFSRQQDMGKLIESREEMCILRGKISRAKRVFPVRGIGKQELSQTSCSVGSLSLVLVSWFVA